MPIHVDVDATEPKQTGKQLRGVTIQDILQRVKPALFRELNTAKNAIRNNLSGSILNRRSGQLAAAVDFTDPRRLAKQDVLQSRIGILRGPARKYADIHLTGGVIRPVNARKLAVPLPAALTAGGVARYSSPLRQTLAAAFPDGTFVAKDILFGKVGNEITPLFALKDSVRIPKRDYMKTPIQKLIASVRSDVAQSAVNVIVGAGRRGN